MARGHPDYNNYKNVKAVNDAPYSDIVSAVRRFLRVDGRGRIIWLDDFSEGLGGWVLSRSAGNSWPYLTRATYDVFLPPVSCALPCDLVSSNSGIVKTFGRFEAGAFGAELMLNSQSDEFDIYVLFRYGYADGADYWSRLWYDTSAEKWQVSTTGGWVTIEDWSGNSKEPTGWYPLKIVADFSTGLYKRALIGTNEYDLSAYTMNSGTFLASNELRIDIEAYEGGGGTGDTQIGYVVITSDEP